MPAMDNLKSFLGHVMPKTGAQSLDNGSMRKRSESESSQGASMSSTTNHADQNRRKDSEPYFYIMWRS